MKPKTDQRSPWMITSTIKYVRGRKTSNAKLIDASKTMHANPNVQTKKFTMAVAHLVVQPLAIQNLFLFAICGIQKR